MAKLLPKLNLNKVPQSVENNSLIFAKNVKLLTDNTITCDSSIDTAHLKQYAKIIGHIVGINSKIYVFTERVEDEHTYHEIHEIDEITNTDTIIDCSWTYSGGNITGCVTVNNTGEFILTIAEYFDEYDLNNNNNVPIKHINLSKCSSTDDESIYTQHPKLPITNLSLVDYYNTPIPSGVYQFFIRYKIRKDFYTSWMPCSTELYAINQNEISTIQGPIYYNDIKKEANKSFVFETNNLVPNNLQLYEEFQLGFIISRDNGVFARSWKHFKINTLTYTSKIIFTYNDEDVTEENIDDFITGNYELFNVKNVITYKNKLFISNYKESNFNDYDNCSEFAKNIKIDLKRKYTEITTDGYYLAGNKLRLNYEETYYDAVISDDGVEMLIDYFTNVFFDVKNLNAEQPIKVNTTTDVNKVIVIRDFFITIDEGVKELITESRTFTGDDAWLNYQDYVYNNTKIIGINQDGYPIIKIDNVQHILRGYSYSEGYQHDKKIFTRDYDYIITPKYNIKYIEHGTFETSQTLMPFTNYDFYCHFIKENGVITNGFYIDSIYIKRFGKYVCNSCINYPNLVGTYLEDVYDNIFDGNNKIQYSVRNELCSNLYEHSLTYSPDREHSYGCTFIPNELKQTTSIYPTFTPDQNIEIPSGYIGYFISMYKHNNNVTQGFNIKYEIENEGTNNEQIILVKFDSLEHDTSIVNNIDNIIVKSFNGNYITRTAKYIPSGTANPISEFNSLGHIDVNEVCTSKDNTVWTIGNENTIADDNKLLVKVTPFILSNNAYTTNKDLNLLGFINKVSKLTEGDNNYYISGEDVYTATADNDSFNITSFTNKLTHPGKSGSYVHSNYNLDCVSLSQDIIGKLRNYKEGSNDKTQLFYAVDSLIASYILEYQSTFKDYTRRYYNQYRQEALTIFNNTVRASNIDIDETYRNIYKFSPSSYYNIPTNRGIIIYMFTILDTIYIHTEHSLFKFTTNSKLNTNQNEEISLVEAAPFDVGIQEVFDSQYGYGGLQKKEHALVTYNAYIFYDKLANTIYAYDTRNLSNISNPIKKVLEYINPNDVIFAFDNYNDRFYVNLKNDNENVCLSFNFAVNSFISIHDFDFIKSFNSRIKPYFITNEHITGNNEYVLATLDNNQNQGTNYSHFTKTSALVCDDVDKIYTSTREKVGSCIDVVCNIEYEKIKVLNNINWICKAIVDYDNKLDFNLAEEIGEKYSGHSVRIYSDQTYTQLIPLVDAENNPYEANAEPIEHSTSYQYPRFNCGVWSLNYFRDIKNVEDIFNYKSKFDDGYLDPKSSRLNLTQESSLIYGKYFVARFIFKDKKFKLENVIFKMNNYDKA